MRQEVLKDENTERKTGTQSDTESETQVKSCRQTWQDREQNVETEKGTAASIDSQKHTGQ